VKRFLVAIALTVLGVGAIVVIRAARFTPRVVSVPPGAQFTPLPGAPERLSSAVKIPTISPADSLQRDTAAFSAFHEFLAKAYPRSHATMQRERVGRDALLFTWAGTDPALQPIVLMGHMDVVPVAPGTDSLWKHGAFSGDVADGFVWGRGTLDDKGTVLGVLEACEALITSGFKPRRTIMLSFGADEEAGGQAGAKMIASLLQSRGIKPLFVLDEGGTVIKGAIAGITKPVALIGIAEKGYLTVELTVHADGGHSSMPPKHTAAGILAIAITRLESHHMPARIGTTTSALLDAIGPEMSFDRRIAFANRFLFDPIIKRQLASSPGTDATLRTTTAVTMLEGSPKDNVLPSRARAAVNFRILPGDSVAGVIAHVRDVIDDERVEIKAQDPAVEPSPVSSTSDSAWAIVDRSVRQGYPNAIVAPYLVLGATDSRYFRLVTQNVYRFSGARLDITDLERVHGTNERVSIAAYLEGIRFLGQLIQNASH
jgi:carboxypeptidase PM20D1